MEPLFLNALRESTKALFEGMLGLPVTFEPPEDPAPRRTYDISCVIAFSGDVEGSVIVGLWADSALSIAGALAGDDVKLNTPDFADAVGEITNMIAGGAKSRLQDRNASISCPSVIMASEHLVSTPRGVDRVGLFCVTPKGRFVIDTAVKTSAVKAA